MNVSSANKSGNIHHLHVLVSKILYCSSAQQPMIHGCECAEQVPVSVTD